MKIEEKKKSSKSLTMNKFSLNMFKSGSKIFENVSQPLSGFLGCMPDCLTMDYVKEEKGKGIMKMEKVTLCHDDSDVILSLAFQRSLGTSLSSSILLEGRGEGSSFGRRRLQMSSK